MFNDTNFMSDNYILFFIDKYILFKYKYSNFEQKLVLLLELGQI